MVTEWISSVFEVEDKLTIGKIIIIIFLFLKKVAFLSSWARLFALQIAREFGPEIHIGPMEIRNQYGGGKDNCYGSGSNVSQEFLPCSRFLFHANISIFNPLVKRRGFFKTLFQW